MNYFIDFTDDQLTLDDEGLEYATPEDACAAAVESLPAILRDKFAGRGQLAAALEAGESRMAVQVRDPSGRVLFRARLHLDMDWPADRD